MRRRDVLVGGATVAAAIATRPAFAKKANSTDFVVVGGGMMGAWTAYSLLRSGASVTLVDEFGAGNKIASSGGYTRVMRAHYGGQIVYTTMAIHAAEKWEAYQEEWGESLLVRSDIVRVGPASLRSRVEQEAELLSKFGIAVNGLTPQEARLRWPGLLVRDDQMAAFSSGRESSSAAAGSVLLARRSCESVIEKFVQLGGRFELASIDSTAASEISQHNSLTLSTGERLQTDSYIFACGSWMPEIFPEIMKPRSRVESRIEIVIEPPKGSDAFSAPNFPIWGIHGQGYGTPDVAGLGFKIAQGGTEQSQEKALKMAQEYFPNLGTRIREMKHCYVTETPNSDFIIDRHPEIDCISFVCGGAGHAAKHGPAIGEYAAAKFLGSEVDHDYDEAFKLREEKVF